ncbi:LysM peptidoglycan-binding domain-containing protein [Limosilactobacillus sp. Lr3000]|uniref:LysM peptidoglycan-binding domain-containing protein n=2 Tax=Limosilactobacillus albertensis TaxID=2759752 RepID=A0A839H6S6_9LACO|nr:LysM peptidoglycan-binding domain-containing protein [Limosilactobacillus albertensis]
MFSQIGGYYNGSFVPHWTYGSQVQTFRARGQHVHTYIYAQFSGRWQADQMLNYYLPRVTTPKGSIVALDVESGNPDTDSVLYALGRIKAAGYTPILYGYKNFLVNHINLQYISTQYPLWLAEYPDYSVRRYPNFGFFPSFNNVAIFQFTSTYVLGGLDGDVDLTGITNNGYTQNTNPTVTQPVNRPSNTQKQQPQPAANTYTVRYGDSWWSIANRHGMNMYTLAQINGRSISSMLYPGQTLRIRANVQTNQQSKNSGSTWRDALGDTWHKENGTFTSNTWLNLRWGARTSSSRIALLNPGSTVKYDAWSNHGGYVWVRQPRNNGYGYVVVRNAVTHQAYGSFK